MAVYIFECEPEEKDFWQATFPDQVVCCVNGPFMTLDQAKDIADDAEVVSVFVKSQISEEMIAALPNLRMIATRSTGFNHINPAAESHGITVSNVPSYGENTVAEQAFALLLALSRKVVESVNRTRAGGMSQDGLMGFDLRGKTIGVIGTGRIGCHMLKMTSGFEMRRIAYDLYPNEDRARELDFMYVSLEQLVRESDIISLHVALTPESHHMLNWEVLQYCKPSLVVINTARGELIDTQVLLDFLHDGKIAAAGLDVFEGESALIDGNPGNILQQLLSLPNVLITPHVAFDTKEAVERIRDTSVENIRGYFSQSPKNVVVR